jgi:hypothetical protein
MFRNCRIVAAAVFLTMALGTGAAAASIATTDPSHTYQLPRVNADEYYGPSGNSVTWPIGPSLF